MCILSSLLPLMASSKLIPSSLPQTVSATVSSLVLSEPQNSSFGGQELNLLEGLPKLKPHVTRSKSHTSSSVIGAHCNGVSLLCDLGILLQT